MMLGKALGNGYAITAVLGKKKIMSSIQYENIFGMQFHPEKSGKNGLKIIKNFLNQIKN